MELSTNPWPSANADGGRIPGAEMVLFIVRVDGRSPCLDPMVVNSLAATSRSVYIGYQTLPLYLTFKRLTKPSSLAPCSHPSTAFAASGCKFLWIA